jgi:hypothetical protein
MTHDPPAWPGDRSADAPDAAGNINSAARTVVIRWIAFAALAVGGANLLIALVECAIIPFQISRGGISLSDAYIVAYLTAILLSLISGGALAAGGWFWRRRNRWCLALVQWGAIGLILAFVIVSIASEIQMSRFRGRIPIGERVLRVLTDILRTGISAAPIVLLLVLSRLTAVRRFALGLSPRGHGDE